jgi:hypothetical protein
MVDAMIELSSDICKASANNTFCKIFRKHKGTFIEAKFNKKVCGALITLMVNRANAVIYGWYFCESFRYVVFDDSDNYKQRILTSSGDDHFPYTYKETIAGFGTVRVVFYNSEVVSLEEDQEVGINANDLGLNLNDLLANEPVDGLAAIMNGDNGGNEPGGLLNVSVQENTIRGNGPGLLNVGVQGNNVGVQGNANGNGPGLLNVGVQGNNVGVQGNANGGSGPGLLNVGVQGNANGGSGLGLLNVGVQGNANGNGPGLLNVGVQGNNVGVQGNANGGSGPGLLNVGVQGNANGGSGLGLLNIGVQGNANGGSGPGLLNDGVQGNANIDRGSSLADIGNTNDSSSRDAPQDPSLSDMLPTALDEHSFAASPFSQASSFDYTLFDSKMPPLKNKEIVPFLNQML